uniref:Uncharacterized protein n=1 Tax=Acrobeloides nanus TaxID=290746 RepID=A0A914EDL3_9BILA
MPSAHASTYDEVYEPVRDDPMISFELARPSNRSGQSPYDHIPSIYDDVYESLGDRPGNNQAMMEGIEDASLTLADESIPQGCPTTRNQSSLSPILMYDEGYEPGHYDQVPVGILENSERPVEIKEFNHSHYYDDVTKAIELLQPTLTSNPTNVANRLDCLMTQ